MGYPRPTNSMPSNPAKESKAVAFMNFSLPSQGGNDRKIGAIALRGDKPQEEQLAVWLLSGTEEEKAEKLAKVLANLVLTVQSAEVSANSFFALDQL
jgi:hypothetical protein